MNENQFKRSNPGHSALYERASQSAKDTRQAVTTLATGSLAVFFFALTTKIDPLLTNTQRWVVLFALALMAVSAFAGLWSAWSDARWSYSWGREVENRADDMSFWEVEKDRWHRRKLWGERWCLGAFVTGVLVAAGYVALRAYGI